MVGSIARSSNRASGERGGTDAARLLLATATWDRAAEAGYP
jgi:hypothetical protein